MSDLPLISVVTPSFNQGKYIRQTIESVLSQNYPNFEHIVMDGGSTDETVSVLKSYPHLIWKSEPDKGQSDALNKALAIARGDIIAWINSDDYYLPNTFHLIARELQNYPVVMGRCLLTKISGEIDGELPHVERRAEDLLKYWCYFSRPPQPAIFFTRSLLETVRRPDGLYVDNNFNICMDFDLWMRFWDRAPAKLLDHQVCVYRMTETNKTGGGKVPGQHEEVKVFNRYSGLEKEPITVTIAHSDEFPDALPMIRNHLEEFNFQVECIKTHPGSVHQRWHWAQANSRGSVTIFLEDQPPNYADLAASVHLIINSPWVGGVSVHPEYKEFTPLNFNALGSAPFDGASYVMRNYALGDVGGIRSDARAEFSLRELLCRLSAKGWGVIGAPSTRSSHRTSGIDTLFAPYSLAKIAVELNKEQQSEPFAQVRISHGFSPRIPPEAISQCENLLKGTPSDLHRLNPDDESAVRSLAESYRNLPLSWQLLSRLYERQGRTSDAEAAREQGRVLSQA